MNGVIFMFVWTVIALLALGFFGRVIWLERQNPKTEITYGGIVLGVAAALFPALGLVVITFCVIEFPQHFKRINRTIYKGN